jgi:hypothetical protein
MRLWSLHPRYFDRQALTACWREALLAQSILARGGGGGYSRHPQLDRFRAQRAPLDAIGAFLVAIADEADARGYHFAREKIVRPLADPKTIPVSTGQLAYEWGHLKAKLKQRSPELAKRWAKLARPVPHPLFTPVEGPIAPWERPKD